MLCQILGTNRQLAQPLAGGGEDGVGDGGNNGRRAGFADSAGRGLARHDVHFHHRHFVDAQHVVVVEVLLHHAALSMVMAPFIAALKP